KRHPGTRVAVLEREVIGAGASGRTTGMLSPGVGQSFLKMLARHGESTAKHIHAATLDAVRHALQVIEEEHLNCELEASGQLNIGWSARSRRRLGEEA